MKMIAEGHKVRITLSIDKEQFLWLKKTQRHSPSKILRVAVNELMEKERNGDPITIKDRKTDGETVRISVTIEERQLLWLKKKQKYQPSRVLQIAIDSLMKMTNTGLL